MPLNSNAIVSLAEAKNYLNITAETNDSVIERMINDLSEEFEDRTERKIKQRTLTDYRIDGNGTYCVYLPFVPVQSVTKVEIRYTNEVVFKTITDTTKFILKSMNVGRLELIEDLFMIGSRNILITMSIGYPTTDCHWSSFQTHFLNQLHWDYQEWDKNIIGVSSRGLQDGSVQYLPRSRFIPKVQQFLRSMRDGQALHASTP